MMETYDDIIGKLPRELGYVASYIQDDELIYHLTLRYGTDGVSAYYECVDMYGDNHLLRTDQYDFRSYIDCNADTTKKALKGLYKLLQQHEGEFRVINHDKTSEK